jgi:hypothetical protein
MSRWTIPVLDYTQQSTMGDPEDDYLAYLSSQALTSPSGIPAFGIRTQNESRENLERGSMAQAFLAAPESGGQNRTRSSRSRFDHDKNHRSSYYWIDNLPVYETEVWNSMSVQVPRLCPMNNERRKEDPTHNFRYYDY